MFRRFFATSLGKSQVTSFCPHFHFTLPGDHQPLERHRRRSARPLTALQSSGSHRNPAPVDHAPKGASNPLTPTISSVPGRQILAKTSVTSHARGRAGALNHRHSGRITKTFTGINPARLASCGGAAHISAVDTPVVGFRVDSFRGFYGCANSAISTASQFAGSND